MPTQLYAGFAGNKKPATVAGGGLFCAAVFLTYAPAPTARKRVVLVPVVVTATIVARTSSSVIMMRAQCLAASVGVKPIERPVYMTARHAHPWSVAAASADQCALRDDQ
jgi:hypothetical protein